MRLGPYLDPATTGAGITPTATATTEPAASAPAPVNAPAATPAAAEPPAGDRPRDDRGRFTKENIERAAGLTPEPAATIPAVPAAITEPATTTAATAAPLVPPAAEPAATTTDADFADLDAFLKTDVPGTAPASTPATSVAAAPASVPATPQAAALQQIMAQPEVASAAIADLQAHQALRTAAARGDIAGILNSFAPGIIDAMREHFYTQNKDGWAERYTKEASGVQADPRVEMLQRQLADLSNQWTAQQRAQIQAQQQTQQQAQAAQMRGKLGGYVDGLFKSVKLDASPHRSWIQSRLIAEIQRNPQAVDNIRQGRFGDLGAKFREVYSEFRPLLQVAASTTQPPAAQPSGAAQLMQTASAAASTATPAELNPSTSKDLSGTVPGEWLKARLKKIVG